MHPPILAQVKKDSLKQQYCPEWVIEKPGKVWRTTSLNNRQPTPLKLIGGHSPRWDTLTTYQIHKCNGEILRDTILTITWKN